MANKHLLHHSSHEHIFSFISVFVFHNVIILVGETDCIPNLAFQQFWFHILWIAFVYLYLDLYLYLYLHLYLYQYLYFSLQQPEFVAPLTFRIKRPHPQDESCLSWSSFGLSSKTKSMAWQRQNTPKRSKRPDNRLQVKMIFFHHWQIYFSSPPPSPHSHWRTAYFCLQML